MIAYRVIMVFNVAMIKKNEVRVGIQGRVVIPAHIRRALGIGPGQVLLARMEDGRLVLETPEQVLSRLYARFEMVPPGVSLADELIADRREAARKEALP